jgi:peptidoglycan/LPS O-acetylase OafA/YrhL
MRQPIMDTPASPAQLSRPPQVTLALALFACGLLLAPARAVIRADSTDPLHGGLSASILIGIALLWIYGLHRRKKWVWWFTVVALFIGVIGIPFDVARQGVGLQLTLYYAQCVVAAAVVLLLCLAPSRRWFHVSSAGQMSTTEAGKS